jgi:hypothetical protein
VVGTDPSKQQPRQPIGGRSGELRGAPDLVRASRRFAAENLSNEAGRPDQFSGRALTVAAFDAVGVQPILDRGFRAGDDRSGARALERLTTNDERLDG